MTSRRCLFVALAAVAVLSSPGEATAGVAVTTEYDVRYGPVTILSLRATTELADRRYRADAEMRTTGLAALLFPWQASATSEGQREADNLRPMAHRSSGEFRGQRRTVQISYGAGGSVVTAVQPPADADDRDPVPESLQQHTVDPLTATLSAIASPCNGSVRVFDGRRRYDILFTDLGDTVVPRSRRSAYSGRARHCQGTIKPLAGFWRSEPQHDERPTQLEYWIASPDPDLPPIPVYIELSAPRGTLSIHLTEFAAADLQPRPKP
jgi:hypothetical protein